jgi:hypothetical protein
MEAVRSCWSWKIFAKLRGGTLHKKAAFTIIIMRISYGIQATSIQYTSTQPACLVRYTLISAAVNRSDFLPRTSHSIWPSLSQPLHTSVTTWNAHNSAAESHVLCDPMPCQLVKNYRRFEGPYCPYLQGQAVQEEWVLDCWSQRRRHFETFSNGHGITSQKT